MGRVTLRLAGRPFTFDSQVDLCLVPRPKPGPCPGTKRGGSAVSKAAKRLTQPGKGKAKGGGGDDAESSAQQKRLDMVEKIMDGPTHQGESTDKIMRSMTLLRSRKGWGDIDQDDMSASYRSPFGKGRLEMVPDGWQAEYTRDGKDEKARRRTFKKLSDAVTYVETVRTERGHRGPIIERG